MQQELTTPETQPELEFKLSPEALALTEVYLQTLDVKETSQQLGITQEEVTHYLNKKEIKRFLDTIFLEQGYRNKHKLGDLLDTMIASKLEEAEDTGIYSSKDLLDIVVQVHKMRMEEIKATQDMGPKTQINTQINDAGATSNLSKLIESLVRE